MNCDWCGVGLDEAENWQLLQPHRNLAASFCRLEHVVPWLIKKDDWHIRDRVEVPESAGPDCSGTGVELEKEALYLVRYRDGMEIADGFVSKEAVLAWAKAGGRWAK